MSSPMIGDGVTWESNQATVCDIVTGIKAVKTYILLKSLSTYYMYYSFPSPGMAFLFDGFMLMAQVIALRSKITRIPYFYLVVPYM